MKRILSVFLGIAIILLLLPGCGDDPLAKYKNLPDEYVAETDVPIGFSMQANGMQPIAPTEDGYYFMSHGFIYYMDNKTMKPAVLCSRPECKHEKETEIFNYWKCDGCFESGQNYLQYYEGSLYVITSLYSINGKSLLNGTSEVLVRLSPDGTQRDAIAPIKHTDGSRCFRIHRGYFYSCTCDPEGKYIVSRVPITSPNIEPEIVYTGQNIAVATGILFYGNHLYLTLMETADMTCRFIKIDLLTLENRSIEESFTQDNPFLTLNGVKDGKLLIQRNNYTDGSLKASDMIFYDPISEKTQNLLDLTPYSGEQKGETLYSDGENLLLLSTEFNTQISLISLDNDLVPVNDPATLNVKNNFFFAGDENYAFCFDHDTWYFYVFDKNNGCKAKLIFDSPCELSASGVLPEDYIGPIKW